MVRTYEISRLVDTDIVMLEECPPKVDALLFKVDGVMVYQWNRADGKWKHARKGLSESGDLLRATNETLPKVVEREWLLSEGL